MTTWHEERLLIDGELVPADGRRDLRDHLAVDRGRPRRGGRRDRRRRPAGDRRGPARVRHDRLVARPRVPGALPAPAAPGAARQRRAAARDPRPRGRRAGLEHERSATRRPDRRRAAGTPTCSRATTSSRTSVTATRSRADTTAGSRRRRPGVVGAIAAYNYPIQLALAKLAPALAAGCTVVLKGAPDTPWATLALGKLVAEATDIPAGRRERALVVRQRGRRRADDASRRRRRVVHRARRRSAARSWPPRAPP